MSFELPHGERGLAEVGSILDLLISERVAVEDYAIRRPTLEEAFLQLVAGNASGSLVEGGS